jgi:hypothetical protein
LNSKIGRVNRPFLGRSINDEAKKCFENIDTWFLALHVVTSHPVGPYLVLRKKIIF